MMKKKKTEKLITVNRYNSIYAIVAGARIQKIFITITYDFSKEI